VNSPSCANGCHRACAFVVDHGPCDAIIIGGEGITRI